MAWALCVEKGHGPDPPVGKHPAGGGVEHALPVRVILERAVPPGHLLVETLHRAAAEGACAGKEDVVGTRPGDVKEEATFSVHTKAASEANLVPGAA